MTAIWKYPVDVRVAVGREVIHELPSGAKFISALRSEDEVVDVYFEVNPEAQVKEHRRFTAYMTGENLSWIRGQHIGTFKSDWIVYHVYMD